MLPAPKYELIQQLQREVNSLQGYGKQGSYLPTGMSLGPIDHAFPGQVFPTGIVHEFLSASPEGAAATNGFISGLLGQLMGQGKPCIWVGKKRMIYPPALRAFGLAPEKIIFIDLCRQKDILWSIEEALKCKAVAAVVGEFGELTFKESRRLQLAVEQSQVTGLIHRINPRSENTTACITRWKISSLPSMLEEGMPGIGYPRWHVRLLKVRNGKPGSWHVEWSPGGFRHISSKIVALPQFQTPNLKTG